MWGRGRGRRSELAQDSVGGSEDNGGPPGDYQTTGREPLLGGPQIPGCRWLWAEAQIAGDGDGGARK